MTHLFNFSKEYFQLIKSGEKNFILTKRDRPYKNGDEIVIQEIDEGFGLTSDELRFKITLVENGEGIKSNYCIIAICPQDYIKKHEN
jgi:ASC-1-like (ASCH) protein